MEVWETCVTDSMDPCKDSPGNMSSNIVRPFKFVQKEFDFI